MKQIECPRCEGKGYIAYYQNVQGGICFRCAGSGKVEASTVHKPSPEKIAAEEARCAKANSQADRIYDKLAETYGERPEVVNARTRQAREESLMMAYNREHGTRWNLADRGKWLAALKIS